jgi:pyruvate dehydrogenase E1 component alpha subunit
MGKNDLSSMHLHSDGIFKASTSIVGGIIPVATGAAWAKKLKNEPGIVVCFLGDGATEEGSFGESLSFSVLHGLQILFIVQNNKLAVTTPIEDRHKYDISAVARAYGLGASKIDGGIETLSQMTACVIEEVKKGIPFLLEIDVERQRVHCGIEHEYTLQNDPLLGYNTDESEINQEIEAAFEFARQSPAPTEVRGIYAD